MQTLHPTALLTLDPRYGARADLRILQLQDMRRLRFVLAAAF
jgi:hypothetical protein